MARLRRFLATPFGVAVVGLLALAGWATWSAGVFDGPVARQVRVSSVYAAPGTGLDVAAAERVIGNRRLVVVFLDRGADFGDACDDVEDAAAGTLVMFFTAGDDELDHYGCSRFPGSDIDGENFGKAFVAENVIAQGADQFVDRPLEAVKILAVNYDALVKSGSVPDGPRTIEASFPRYLLAGAAVLAVLGGAVTVFLASRRVGGLAARRRGDDEALSDARASLNARVAVLAGQIIELDRRPTERSRRLAADYAELAAELTGGEPSDRVTARVEALTRRARDLARPGRPARSGRRSKRASR
jgi:hypothetical protein